MEKPANTTPISEWPYRRAAGCLVAVVSRLTDPGYVAIGEYLSIAMAVEGKRVCLIHSGQPDSADRPPDLTQLINGSGCMEAINREAPAGLSTLCGAACLDHFGLLSPAQQRKLIAFIAQLEREFDCIVIETTNDTGAPSSALLNMAQLLVIVPTTAVSALTSAFETLRALDPNNGNRSPYLLIAATADLPAAHAVFKRLRRVAARYLQLECRYLGYCPDNNDKRATRRERLDAMLQSPRSARDRSLQLISERFRSAMARLEPSNRLSESLRRQRGINSGSRDDTVAAPRAAAHIEIEARNDYSADKRAAANDDGFASAMRIAAHLAETRPQPTDEPLAEKN